ncbi:MAG TPA: lysophospholipid acyltransferase family protein [Bacillus sp. (in: firmicutes)]|uniref:lysophospholipid acyltransferase family protein n=1 Tax=Bacillus litorisediminis TaxID=2922713 RepID=UPI001FAF7679|nr:lysophospholipid acyltransferase family protein [Bacillus litorisediminis]HWO75959.1 lysophospholipid acyltransferase family protein [Bacillus sp. (in: firmicutes)]
MERRLYYALKPIAKLWMRLKFRIEIIGWEHIPNNDPFIIAANHVSNYDPILLSCLLKRKVYFMAKAELFRNRFSHWFFTHVYAIPVDRTSGVVIRPVRKALKVIKDGELFGIFPEGKRCNDGEIVEPKKGVAFLASKTETPILPISIIGIKKGFRVPIKVVIGSQISVTSFEYSDYSSVTRAIMDRIRELGNCY